MSDDVFENVKAPVWADSLNDDNRADEEFEESFFPEPLDVEEVAQQVEQLVVRDNPEDLARLALFGNKPPVKRRSQIRREQEAAKLDDSTPGNFAGRSQSSKAPSQPPSRPISRDQSMDRRSGPQTRSMTRASSLTRPPVLPPKLPIRQSRGIDRKATSVREPLPSPCPSQHAFNRALNSRASSLGKGGRIPTSTPARADKPHVRAPITVNNSPRPRIAFGCLVRQKPEQPRSSAIRPRTENLSTPRNRALPLRAYPTPTGTTPARPLTVPVTPILGMSRSSSTNRWNSQRQPTPKRTIPNTYTHGLFSASKVRRCPPNP